MIPVNRQQVIDEARKHLGVTYQHRGRGGASGMDCIGIAIVVGQALGQLPENVDELIPDYQPHSLPRLMSVFWEYMEQIDVSDVLPGYGYLVTHKEGKRASHLAIATEHGLIQVSPYVTLNRVVEHSINGENRARLILGWKFKGLVD